MEAALSDPNAVQRWVIYDEAWRLVREPALLARKLFRGLGIANLVVIHRLYDLDAVGNANSESRGHGLLVDCSTKIFYQRETSSEAPHTADVLGLPVAGRNELPDLLRGEGLERVGQRAFVVRLHRRRAQALRHERPDVGLIQRQATPPPCFANGRKCRYASVTPPCRRGSAFKDMPVVDRGSETSRK